MKAILLILFVASFVSSCVEISFTNPQPQGIADETSFPDELQGKYIAKSSEKDDYDTIVFSGNNIKYHTPSNANEIDESLSDSVKLRIYKNYYFINIKDKNYWVLYVLKLKKNKLEVQSLYRDTIAQIEKIKKITKVEEILKDDGTPDRYVLDPTPKELMKILKKGIFIKAGTFEKITE